LAHDSIVDVLDEELDAVELNPGGPILKTGLYPHQTACLGAIKRWFQNPVNEVALAVVPTGGGKSGIAVLAPYILNTARVLVITPSVEITRQLELDFCGGENQRGQFIQPFMVRYGVASVEHQSEFVEAGFAALKSTDSGPKLIQKLATHNLVLSNAHKLSPVQSESIVLNQVPQNFDLVIVDEAHHYPAETWKQVVDHFRHSKKLFLTATPYHQGARIRVNNVELPICYEISKQALIDAGVIRALAPFAEVPHHRGPSIPNWTLEQMEYHDVVQALSQILIQHDALDPTQVHQAMVLTHTTPEADSFAAVANSLQVPTLAYYQGSPDANLTEFQKRNVRVLVVCGRLLEGFDQKTVSVAVILRNVAASSRVLFTQFVGRAVRKIHPEDPVSTVVLSHAKHKQLANFEAYHPADIAEVEPQDG